MGALGPDRGREEEQSLVLRRPVEVEAVVMQRIRRDNERSRRVVYSIAGLGLAVALVSLVVAWAAFRHDRLSALTDRVDDLYAMVGTLQRSRVETGKVASNSNAPGFNLPWTPWEEQETRRTTYLGVQREVRFRSPFESVPEVTASLALINLRPFEAVLRDCVASPSVPANADELWDHVITSAVGQTQDGFTLRVGIGLPADTALGVANFLQQTSPDDLLVTEMRKRGQLDPASSALSPDEAWMANFYGSVGSIQVSWFAQAIR